MNHPEPSHQPTVVAALVFLLLLYGFTADMDARDARDVDGKPLAIGHRLLCEPVEEPVSSNPGANRLMQAAQPPWASTDMTVLLQCQPVQP